MYYPVGTTFKHESGVCHSVVAQNDAKITLKRLSDGERKNFWLGDIIDRVNSGELEQLQ